MFTRHPVAFALTIFAVVVPVRTDAAFVPVYGCGTYLNGNGYFANVNAGVGPLVNDLGMAVVTLGKQQFPGGKGQRALRWNAAGNLSLELPHLGTDPGGTTNARLLDLNNSNVGVGNAEKYDASGNLLGLRPVRWDVGAGTIQELPQRAVGVSDTPEAVNASGVSVGGLSRWNATGTSVTALQPLPNDGTGNTTFALAINESGVAVGWGQDTTNPAFNNRRAVRGDTAGVATPLGFLGIAGDGHTQSEARAINGQGTAIGYALKYDAQHHDLGQQAVKWLAGTTTAVELGNLGTDSTGVGGATAYAINATGTIVGASGKFDGAGTSKGARAVRWASGNTTAIELGTLGTDPAGFGFAEALDVNDAGLAVGHADLYVGGSKVGMRAVLWGLDGVPIDLNSLIDPNVGWTLANAFCMSNTNWVAGIGTFDPDGPGGEFPYGRPFLIQVPEPTAAFTLVFPVLLVALRRRA